MVQDFRSLNIIAKLAYGLSAIVVAACGFVLMTFKPIARDLGTVALASGEIGGTYFEVGGVVARLMTQAKLGAALRIVVEPTSGSVENLNLLLDGKQEFAIVQADAMEDAVRGLGPWTEKGPQASVRVVSALYEEVVTLVVPEASPIKSIKDLKGYRVNIGPKGSGTQLNAIRFLEGAELDWKTQITAVQEKVEKSADLLRAQMIDAYFVTGAHPAEVIEDTIKGGTKIRFVPLPKKEIELGDTVAFRDASIPVSAYGGAINRAPVPTVAVTALLVARADVKNEVVFTVVQRLFEDPRRLAALHPVLAQLTLDKAMVGAVGEMHPGALRFFDPEGFSGVKAVFGGGKK